MRKAILGAISAAALITITASSVGAKSAGKADSSTAYAATTHTSASGIQYIAGSIQDKLLGPGAVTYTVAVKSVPTKPGTYNLTVKPVTSWFSTGSLTGTSKAMLTVGAKSLVQITGTLNEPTGTGALAGHSFKGTVTGSGSLITSQYVFHVKGTYK
jgi:hypothetical protein